MDIASIPSPSQSVWYLGPIPIRAYALAIIAGIFLAVWITDRRLRRRGGPPGFVIDVAVIAVPLGIIGARIYHVITDAQEYFGAGKDPVAALMIWRGGLGIPGAILGGALGAWWVCRRRGVTLSILADALAPALPLAQAVGRFGNYFNQELFGRPTNLPWALEIDLANREVLNDPKYLQYDTFHPTFLYEALWNVGAAGFIWWIDKRYNLGRGRAFALYVVCYAVGRFWVESLRIDPAHSFLGLRLNMWTALVAMIGGAAYFLLVRGARQHLVTDADGVVTGVVTAPEPAAGDAGAGADRDEPEPGPDADEPPEDAESRRPPGSTSSA